MFPSDTRLGASHAALIDLLHTRPDLRDGPALTTVLELLRERRAMDLSDLAATDRAALIAARARHLIPSTGHLADLLASGRPLVVKFGIDPTASDVHIGHTVPMMLASRFQRMGHRVVFIVGDVTAKIGDPSGRVTDRPSLTDEQVRANVRTYRQQVGPYLDFANAEFRFNSEWLGLLTLPRFLAVLERLPVATALQRDDFRDRLAAGAGLTMAELVYAVVMALDSVEIAADIELGGIDQLLNMQMCRRVMEDSGQKPEVIIATGLIEGTDGTGAKMSKSRGNYVGLAFAPSEVYGRLMSIPDRLLPDYLRALTELLDPEIDLLMCLHPLGAKTLLASDITGALHGPDAAAASRAAFRAQFSRRRYSDTPGVPVVDAAQCGGSTIAELFAAVSASTGNHVRRVARGGGLRLVGEGPGEDREMVPLADANETLSAVLAAHALSPGTRTFLRCGRSLIEIR
jgi:tyrosyl-tRNA synthetase